MFIERKSDERAVRSVALTLADPRSADSGGRIRDYFICGALAELGTLKVFSFTGPRTAAPRRELEAVVHLARPRSYPMALALSTAKGQMFHERRFDWTRLSDRLESAISDADIVYFSMPYSARVVVKCIVESRGPRPFVIWDTQNFDPGVWEAREHLVTPTRRAFIRRQRRFLTEVMEAAGSVADLIVACTTEDAKSLDAYFSQDKRIEIVPNGAEVARFAADRAMEQGRVLISGGLSRDTNHLGAMYFLREVWADYSKEDTEATLVVAGRHPSRVLRRAVKHLPRVTLVADPPDMAPYMASAAVIAAPQAYAGGSKIKMFESLASGRAVLAAPQAVMGLPVELRSAVTVCETTEEWVSALRMALRRAALPDGTGLQESPAQRWLRENGDWGGIQERFRCTVIASMEERNTGMREPH